MAERKKKIERKKRQKEKKRKKKKRQTDERDHRVRILASLNTIITKQNGQYLFIGAKSMPYHQSKKVLFLPYLSFENKKSFLVAGGQVGEN